MKLAGKLVVYFIFIFSLSLSPHQRALAHGTGEIRSPELYKELLSKLFSSIRKVEKAKLSRETGVIVEQGGIYYSMDRLFFSAVVDQLIDDLVHDDFKECKKCEEDFKIEAKTKLQRFIESTKTATQSIKSYSSNVKNFLSTGLPFMAADYIGEYGYFAALFKGIFEAVETISLPIHGMCWLGDGAYFILDFPLRHLIRAKNLKDTNLSFSERVEIYKSFMLKFNRLLFSFTKLFREDFPNERIKRNTMIESVEKSLEARGEVIDLFFDSLIERDFFTRPQNWVFGTRFMATHDSSSLPIDAPSVKVKSFEDVLIEGSEGLSKDQYIKKLRNLAQIEYSQQQFLLALIRQYTLSKYQAQQSSYLNALKVRYYTGKIGTALSKLRFALHGLSLRALDLEANERKHYADEIKILKMELLEDLEFFVNSKSTAEHRTHALKSIQRVNNLFYKKPGSTMLKIHIGVVNCLSRLRL